MEIKLIHQLAKASLNETDYNKLINYINNKSLNDARLFIENKVDIAVNNKNIVVKRSLGKIKLLKQLDHIITNEYIKQIDVNA